MAWDYANLSSLAKENGGPEELVQKIFDDGRTKGHEEMEPVVLVTSLVSFAFGTLCLYGCQKWRAHLERKKGSPSNVVQAQNDLVTEIKEYDALHEQTPTCSRSKQDLQEETI